MKTVTKLAAKVTAVTLIASATSISPALATPGQGFTPSNIVSGSFGTLNVNTSSEKTGKWGLVLKTLDESDVGTTRLTVQPGGFSGWHLHRAPIFVTVTQGTIEWVNGSDPLCPPKTYNAGESFIENAYVIHNVRNPSGSETATFYATRVAPTGAAVTVDQAKPNNCNF